jgi:putative PIN family toxin of toxin-antitoxin system
MGTQRIVIDTNVIISAIGWGGTPLQVIDAVLAGDFVLVLSEKQLAEIERVARYPKLQFSAGRRERLRDLPYCSAQLVETHGGIHAIPEDPSDNMLLEAAIEHGAVCIVSGDAHLLKLGEFRGVKKLTPTQFLASLA